jgi:hypothetical protein
MHPLTSKGKEVWRGNEGFQKSLDLIASCRRFADRPLLLNNQVVRPLFSAKDLLFWKEAAEVMPQVVP